MHLRTREEREEIERELLSPEATERRAGIVCFRPRRATAEACHTALQQRGVLAARRGGGVRLSAHFYHGSDDLAEALEQIDSTLDALT